MSRLVLTIDTDNAAFEDRPAEVARILRRAAQLVLSGYTDAALRDFNGNTVGRYTLEADDPATQKGNLIMDDEDRAAIRAAIEVLNRCGDEAASYLKAELVKAENSEAQAQIEDLYEEAS